LSGPGHTIRPALLAREAGYDVARDRLIKYGSTGETAWDIRFADLTGMALVEHVLRGIRMRRLDARVPRDDPERQALARLHRAIAAAVAEARPEIEVRLGEYGWGKRAMFAVGAVSLLGGVAILVTSLASGLSGERLAAGAVPVFFLVLLGLVLGSSYAPWRKTPRVPVGTLPDVLDHLNGPA